MGLATLEGVTFRIDPRRVEWSFDIKVVDFKTLGGKVVQVFGTRLSDMVVSGSFGKGDERRGDTMGWQEQERFMARIKALVDRQIANPRQALHFRYPPRGWDFHVMVKTYTAPRAGGAIRHSNAEINPGWELTLFIVQDNSPHVVKGIQDVYIARLMEGIGWKQTRFNGPTQAEVDEVLSPFGGSVEAYLKQQFSDAARNTLAPVGGAE